MTCSSSIVTPTGEPTKADWNRAAEGIALAGFAVFFLLNTTGVVPWSMWLEAIPLWPLLIVSTGIKMTFEKTRAPWLVLLGPAILLGGPRAGSPRARGSTPPRGTGRPRDRCPSPRAPGT